MLYFLCNPSEFDGHCDTIFHLSVHVVTLNGLIRSGYKQFTLHGPAGTGQVFTGSLITGPLWRQMFWAPEVFIFSFSTIFQAYYLKSCMALHCHSVTVHAKDKNILYQHRHVCLAVFQGEANKLQCALQLIKVFCRVTYFV